MDVEAKRIMALSVSKLYSLRIQRGGLRLHRSLLLSMTMRAARDIYHTAVLLKDTEEMQVVPCASEPATEEPMDTSKDQSTVSESAVTEAPKEISAKPQEPKEAPEEDKENRGAHQCARHSRKRSGKTAVEPDFLPRKKARMDTTDDKQHAQGEVLRTTHENSCRQAETLTAFPTNRAIGAC
ncbi:immediate early response gene 2 protein-like [Myxocyprinus asiaticus]|uniref:immediate early response gene 2 protein-like n=1 Tax=Myxocyprinus asiaticus TaxID=70543 RepID=UPI00222283A1|nr:immediate early response gene 2 protein-like [Myxocyprinus asiaticus]